jgi:N6-adenosine-specific RNA methylase IME4
VEVKHELLRIYVPEAGGLIPPARIESLIKCRDPLELVESWFPTATKLRLAGDQRRDGWTTISSLSQPNSEAATSLTIRPSAQADANGPN